MGMRLDAALSRHKGVKNMEENVARILQMLQEGKVSVNEATTLISAVRGEQAAPPPPPPTEQAAKNEQDRWWKHNCSVPLWVWLWLIFCRPGRCRR
jgi:hypothetical protein